MNFTKLLTQACDILEMSTTQDASGQVSDSWGTLLNAIPTRIGAPVKNFTVEDDKYRATKETYLFLFNPDMEGEITADHRISCQGREYYIVKVGAIHGRKSTHHVEVHAQITSLGGQVGIATGGGTGTGVDDKHYEQEFTLQTSVTVAHNLGKLPAVTVTDPSQVEIECDIQHVDNNNLTVTFSEASTGIIICN